MKFPFYIYRSGNSFFTQAISKKDMHLVKCNSINYLGVNSNYSSTVTTPYSKMMLILVVSKSIMQQ